MVTGWSQFFSCLVWCEAGKRDKVAQQKLVDEVMANVVNEHYFSYVFDKENHKIKYTKHPENYGMRVKGNEVEYYFDFLLAQHRPCKIMNLRWWLMTALIMWQCGMQKLAKERLIFHHFLQTAKARCWNLMSMKIQSYASSLDKSQKNEDDSLGVLFAQKVKIKCE